MDAKQCKQYIPSELLHLLETAMNTMMRSEFVLLSYGDIHWIWNIPHCPGHTSEEVNTNGPKDTHRGYQSGEIDEYEFKFKIR